MRHAFVTGCSRGIGFAIARALLEDGWRVFGTSRTHPDIGHEWFTWAPCDVGSPLSVRSLYDRLHSDDPLDALVHCAATQEPVGPVSAMYSDAWVRSVTTNLVGTFRMVRAALDPLELSPDARILLFSGGGAFSPRPNFSAYAASKAGVVAFMESLAGELPPNVTVNCVAPGFVQTAIHAPTWQAGPDVVGAREHGFSLRPDTGEMAQVVACVRHLLSPAAHGLTGKTISVPHDDWASINRTTVAALNASDMGTRTRHKVSCVRSLVRPKASMTV